MDKNDLWLLCLYPKDKKNTFEWLICVHSAVCVWVRHAGSFAYFIEARYRSSIYKSNELIAVSVIPTLQM